MPKNAARGVTGGIHSRLRNSTASSTRTHDVMQCRIGHRHCLSSDFIQESYCVGKVNRFLSNAVLVWNTVHSAIRWPETVPYFCPENFT